MKLNLIEKSKLTWIWYLCKITEDEEKLWIQIDGNFTNTEIVILDCIRAHLTWIHCSTFSWFLNPQVNIFYYLKHHFPKALFHVSFQVVFIGVGGRLEQLFKFSHNLLLYSFHRSVYVHFIYEEMGWNTLGTFLGILLSKFGNLWSLQKQQNDVCIHIVCVSFLTLYFYLHF